MTGSSIGKIFNLTTFGESHGSAMGGVLQGVPANMDIDIDFVQKELDKRRPGQSDLTSQRKEIDKVEFLSGIFDGKTTGAPIGFLIKNMDQKSSDYKNLEHVFRPSHSDFTYHEKYQIKDHRGGGRSSARETVCRVVAGAIAKQILKKLNIEFSTYVCQVGKVKMRDTLFFTENQIEKHPTRCPDENLSKKMEEVIQQVKVEGDTIGGVVFCMIKNVPSGLGEPVFDKLHAEIGKAMLSINAVKGFEIGSGFQGSEMRGSEHNDIFIAKNQTETNHSGGIQGGISNGMPIYFRVAFKPVSSILMKQNSINAEGQKVTLKVKGRHDPCVVPRAVPIVEAMAAIVILDHFLRNKSVILS